MPNIMPILPGGPTGPESLNPVGPRGLTKQGASADQHLRLQAAMEVEAIFLGQLLEQMRRAMVDPLSSNPHLHS